MRRHGLLLVTLTLTAACGEDAIDPITGGEGGGATGFAVVMTDDPANDPNPAVQRAAPNAFTGVLEGAVRISLRNEGSSLVDLGTADVEVLLQNGADSVVLQDIARPAAGTYVAIQLRFEGVSVEVESGSEVSDSTLTSDVILNVGNGSVATVEITTETFDVDNDTDMNIVVDLNSEMWITLDNIDDAAVSQAELAAAVTVELD